jgi:PAS domain S-box-containing protein
VSAWRGGIGPGLFAAAFAVLFYNMSFDAFDGSTTTAPSGIGVLLALTILAFATSLLGEDCRRWQRRGGLRKLEEELVCVKQSLETEIGLRTHAEGALQEASQMWRALIQASPLAIVVLDPRGFVTTWNSAAERIFGWNETDVSGQGLPETLGDLIGECRSEDAGYGRVASLAGFELRRRRKDGSTIDIELWPAPLYDVRGEFTAQLAIVADITERKRAQEGRERLLGQYEAERTRLETVLQQLPAGVAIVEAPSGRLLMHNEEAERLLRRPLAPLVGANGLPLYAAVHPDGSPFDPADYPIVRSMETGEVVRSATIRFPHTDSGMTYLSVNSAPIRDPEGRIVAAVSVFQDVSERRRAEEERTQLLRKLVTSQEEERHRIARELHDQMGQHLTALTLGLKALRDADDDGKSGDYRLRRLQDLINQIGQEAHRIALELRPTALDDLGLHSALWNYAEEWSERSGIEVDFQSRGLDQRRLDPEVETTVYRVVQEALTNVAKHAEAAHVALILEHRSDHLLAIVEDDGRGFDAEAVLGSPAFGGRMGLVGMKERASLVGGVIQVESSPDNGTALLIRIPLSLIGSETDTSNSLFSHD